MASFLSDTFAEERPVAFSSCFASCFAVFAGCFTGFLTIFFAGFFATFFAGGFAGDFAGACTVDLVSRDLGEVGLGPLLDTSSYS